MRKKVYLYAGSTRPKSWLERLIAKRKKGSSSTNSQALVTPIKKAQAP